MDGVTKIKSKQKTSPSPQKTPPQMKRNPREQGRLGPLVATSLWTSRLALEAGGWLTQLHAAAVMSSCAGLLGGQRLPGPERSHVMGSD